jgi:RNA polymerase sigma factor (sigma-70 family)
VTDSQLLVILKSMQITDTQFDAALDSDPEAITAILQAFDGMIRDRARRIDWRGTEDLAQVGRLALWRCLYSFDGPTVAEFVAYAVRTITGAMMDAHCTARYVGVSRDMAKLWRSAVKRADGDFREAERLLTSGELAWRMHPETVHTIRAAVRPPEPLPDDVAEEYPAASTESPTGAHARFLLGSLGKQQRAVLEMSYGLGEHGRVSDDEIGEALGINRTHVAAVRSRALKRLREMYAGSFFAPQAA